MTPSPPPGLCGECLHARRIESAKGSVFWLCERARDDERLRKYPPIPVLRCVGFDHAQAKLEGQ